MRKKTPTPNTRRTADRRSATGNITNNGPATAAVTRHSATTGAPTALDRRSFLATSMALGAGTLLADLGLSRSAAAQTAPAAGTTPPARPPLPPEPKVSQPPPLKDLKGKVAYVTASSDGIGLGIARAASNAGMIVVIGYRNEERLKAALPLFKPGNPGVFPVKHDVTERDGWKSLLDQVKAKYGKLHLVVNNAGIKTLRQA